jgi:hypothetical protein
MGRVYDALDADLVRWIEEQHLFFVASAPGEGGHVNCSPKGLDSLRILGPHSIAYLDLTGSGAETIAHLRDNGRIVLMFCAFEGPPKVLRLHGHGTAVQPGDPRFRDLFERFLPLPPQLIPAARAVIHIDIERISDSCGYGVPLMHYEGNRTQTVAWADNRLRKYGPDALLQYQQEKNLTSIDDLPAIDPGLQARPAADLPAVRLGEGGDQGWPSKEWP